METGEGVRKNRAPACANEVDVCQIQRDTNRFYFGDEFTDPWWQWLLDCLSILGLLLAVQIVTG